MTNTFKVLWVDDYWGKAQDGAPHTKQLTEWEAQWASDLAAIGVTMSVTRRDSGSIADDLTREAYDALVLDYELSQEPSHPDSNAFKLLERLRRGIRSLPPTAIFSRYPAIELRAHLKGQARGSVWAVFEKSAAGAQELSSFLKNTVLRGPLNFIVISDFHAGFLDEAGGIDSEDFLHSLATDIESVRASTLLDALVVPGDLAWRSQKNDLTRAYLAVKRIASAAGLKRPEQIVFCPGNHDLDLAAGATEPWAHFSHFVDLLTQGSDEHFSSRFIVAWNDAIKTRGKFQSQESLLSIVHNAQRGVVFACLNSSLPTGRGFEVLPVIEEPQWIALQRALESLPKRTFRIAVLHHPLFSAPGGVHKDDASLADQGKAMQLLSKLGFGLVLHGHTHFSGLHSHRIRVLNGAPNARSVSKILTVACPSVIAHPSSSSPHRHYFVVRLDAFDDQTKTRAFSLATRVFNPSDRSWSSGEQVGAGEFDVDSGE